MWKLCIVGTENCGNWELRRKNWKSEIMEVRKLELWKLWKLWNLGNMFNMKIGNCGKYGFGELELLKQKIVRLEIVEIRNCRIVQIES